MNAPTNFHETNPTRAAVGHMPFKGHRTMAEVQEDENRKSLMRSFGQCGSRRRRG